MGRDLKETRKETYVIHAVLKETDHGSEVAPKYGPFSSRCQTLEFSTDHGWFNRKRGVSGLHGPPRWNRPLEKAIIIVVFPGRQHRRGNSRIAVCVIQK